ncbi:phytanoyl-CoA dioxygenase family protein [Nocardia sp. NPDC058518]|uniref:phytanoyl-CoA dioxygenase family protein n=1 Tax=Nocardia sp. NPDC058518 TaxID=3346534 RepID=UPI003657284E
MRPVLDDDHTGVLAAKQFAESGYLIVPGLIPDELCARVLPEVDRWVDQGLRARSIDSCRDPATFGIPPVMELELPAHGEILTHRPLMAILSQLLGPDFVFHHLHSDRHDATIAAKSWHHDYEPNDLADSSLAMVHTLHYLNGLDDTMAALVILPGSHRDLRGKSAMAHLGTDPIAGEVVIDSLPPGSTVLLHSALLHARRLSATTSDRHRYFVDASYCQTGAARWRPVKPYWRHMLARARELGLGAGLSPELFADKHFRDDIAQG